MIVGDVAVDWADDVADIGVFEDISDMMLQILMLHAKVGKFQRDRKRIEEG